MNKDIKTFIKLRCNAHNLNSDGEVVQRDAAEKPNAPKIKDIVKLVENMTEQLLDKVKKLGFQPETLQKSYISGGDVMYVPSGTLIIEKAMNGNDYSLRVPCFVIDEMTLQSLLLVEEFNQAFLSLNFEHSESEIQYLVTLVYLELTVGRRPLG